jgi:uncharacterized protein with NRDE domain
MCTIVALHRSHARYPLVVAANRDEMCARPTAAADVILDAPRTVGGRDLSKGGTWLGATAAGFLVAVTNQRGYGGRDEAMKSRGTLVLDLLSRGALGAALDHLRSIDAREYNAFNLLLGDGDALVVAYARRESAAVAIEELAPGKTWILANDRIGSLDFPKTQRATDLAAPLVTLDLPALADGARAMLGDHEKPPLERVPPPEGSPFPHALLRELQALCIHTPVYGTRSSTLVALEPGRVETYRFADGPPCTTPFTDVTARLR